MRDSPHQKPLPHSKVKKKFSSYVVSRLITFTTISLALTVGVLYTFLSHSMNREFQQRVQLHITETESAILNRIESIKEDVRFLAMDNAVRISLMLGVKSQIVQLVERQYKWEKGVIFCIQKIDTHDYIPELSESTRQMISTLNILATEDDTPYPTKAVNQRQSQQNGKFFYSFNIIRNSELIGDAFALYDISKDQDFWQQFNTDNTVRLICRDEARIIDLKTGRELKVKIDLKTGKALSKDFSSKKERLFHKVWNSWHHENIWPFSKTAHSPRLIAMKKLPGFYYEYTSTPLVKEKQSLILLLLSLCGFIFILSLLVSILIARAASSPLAFMADHALIAAKIASNISDISDISAISSQCRFQEDQNRFHEFQQFSTAFNTLLSSLFSIQRSLAHHRDNLEIMVTEGTDQLHQSRKNLHKIIDALPTDLSLSILSVKFKVPIKRP